MLGEEAFAELAHLIRKKYEANGGAAAAAWRRQRRDPDELDRVLKRYPGDV